MPDLLLRIPEAKEGPEVAFRYNFGILSVRIEANLLAFYVLFVQLNHIVIDIQSSFHQLGHLFLYVVQ